MKGFVDIHTHILPCVDDGAQSLEESLELLKMAWDNGTRSFLLTPHFRGRYKRSPEQLTETFHLLRSAAQGRFPGIELYLGNEIHYETAAPERLAAGQILSMNGSRYALLEFRPSSLRSQITRGVSEIILSGFTPVIAHAERYDIFRKDMSLMQEVLEMGALIQLNADSVLGQQGFGIKRYCHKLLKQQAVHFIASDAHDTDRRVPVLRACYLYIHKKYGADYAAQLFSENGLAVINNQVL